MYARRPTPGSRTAVVQAAEQASLLSQEREFPGQKSDDG